MWEIDENIQHNKKRSEDSNNTGNEDINTDM